VEKATQAQAIPLRRNELEKRGEIGCNLGTVATSAEMAIGEGQRRVGKRLTIRETTWAHSRRRSRNVAKAFSQ